MRRLADGKCKVVIYGTGLNAVKWMFHYEQQGGEVEYFLNTDSKIDMLCGKKVYSPNDEKVHDCYIVVAVSGMRLYLSISKQLQNYGLREFDDYIYYSWIDKQIVLLHGNCHIWIVHKYLESSEEFVQKYAIYPNPAICRNTMGEIEENILKNSDVWIHEEIRTENGYGYKLSDEYIRQKINPEVKEIIFPNLFGLGRMFFPNSNHNYKNNPMKNGQDTGAMFPCTDSLIECCVEQGKNIEEIIEYVANDEALCEEYVIKNFNLYMDKVKEREKICDIKIYDFIMEHYKDEQLFYDMGHPTNVILRKYSIDILKKLGIDDENIHTTVELDAYEMPIYPSIKKHLGIRWEKENIRQCQNAKRMCDKMNLEEYIYEYLWWCYNYRK